MSSSSTDPGFGVFHSGELAAHERYGVGHLTKGLALSVRKELTPALIAFLQRQAFFFLATASDAGDCDCSYRGRQHNRPHDPEPLLIALDERTLIFPDYAGNNFFNSIGNILANPKVGLLFLDFESATRVRINGNVAILEEVGAYHKHWPTATRLIQVDVVQIYPNCRARIPRLVPAY